MKKVLITDDVHPILIAGLQKLNFEVDYKPTIDFKSCLEIIEQYEGLIINSKIFCGVELLSKADHLKWIGRLGAGLEVIDSTICNQKGIHFFNSPEGNRNAVAEHALGMLLNLMNNISISNAEIQEKKWVREPNRGEELHGKTVAIIGFGNTGSTFAKILSGFDINILVYDKYVKATENLQVKNSTLEEIFDKADIISMHTQLTLETTYFCNADFFSKIQKTIYFINTSRGKVVDTKALIRAMKNGNVKGAALDVLENEKFENYTVEETLILEDLIAQKRMLLTAHIAGWTLESKVKIAEVILEKVAQLTT